VGDNGSGKSTLFKLIKAYAGKAPDRLTLAFGNYNSEEEYLKYHKDNYRGELQIDGEIDYRNSVFFDAEEDNPLVAIPKMMTPSIHQLWLLNCGMLQKKVMENNAAYFGIPAHKAKDRILFFDEPETALSLRNQIWLSKALVESAENNHNQIVISTHALAVIQQFDEVFDMETRKWVNRETYVNDMITKKFNKNGRRNKNNR
jgi:predicted ATPase